MRRHKHTWRKRSPWIPFRGIGVFETTFALLSKRYGTSVATTYLSRREYYRDTTQEALRAAREQFRLIGYGWDFEVIHRLRNAPENR